MRGNTGSTADNVGDSRRQATASGASTHNTPTTVRRVWRAWLLTW